MFLFAHIVRLALRLAIELGTKWMAMMSHREGRYWDTVNVCPSMGAVADRHENPTANARSRRTATFIPRGGLGPETTEEDLVTIGE